VGENLFELIKVQALSGSRNSGVNLVDFGFGQFNLKVTAEYSQFSNIYLLLL